MIAAITNIETAGQRGQRTTAITSPINHTMNMGNRWPKEIKTANTPSSLEDIACSYCTPLNHRPEITNSRGGNTLVGRLAVGRLAIVVCRG
jgi:hypothetical protein